MKTQLFSWAEPSRRKIAITRLLVAIVCIAIAIPGMVFLKGSSIFALMYFVGLVLFFYALLYFWLKARYYAISILVYTGLLLLFIYRGINIFVTMEKAGRLHVHGAEDMAWAVGSIFVAGNVAGIIGIVRSRLFGDDASDRG